MSGSVYEFLSMCLFSPCNTNTLHKAIMKIREVPYNERKTAILGFLPCSKDTNADTTREDLFVGGSHPDGPPGFPAVHFFQAGYLCDYSICIRSVLPVRCRQGGLATRERRHDLVFPWSFCLPFIYRIRRQLICEPYFLKEESNGP